MSHGKCRGTLPDGGDSEPSGTPGWRYTQRADARFFVRPVLGSNPFRPGDPRHQRFIEVGWIPWEADARMRTDLLQRANTASPRTDAPLAVEGIIARFVLAVSIMVAC